ncbi:MAG: PEP-CTERM sorting domain-containing protein [Gammaproteobacteria bacterium]|jgi:hypothetical protein|nr:PEP-CTERM sorting domain-containing protein [Gammaproteobacteria bacterium]MBU0771943.1 PEP-CTERM sorting domain-containing protein [Gammaproteobacteria bacterium]MBU0855480.1 PEP-CTERM sorting domain-containing protein [Gammaproteobacteria bacterium]MBU1845704.1 PEP-CTERM sorting domain-containing protein [Gammaproteobacteria bacterium]
MAHRASADKRSHARDARTGRTDIQGRRIVTIQKTLLGMTLGALLLAAGTTQAAPIRYDFTADGIAGYFSYEDSTPTTGNGPFAAGGAAYAALAFSINGSDILNPVVILYDNYGSAGNDFFYVANMTGSTYLQLSGDFLSDNLLTSFGDARSLASFTGNFDDSLYGYGTGTVALRSLAGSVPQQQTVPEPATLSLIGLGVAGALFARRRAGSKTS